LRQKAQQAVWLELEISEKARDGMGKVLIVAEKPAQAREYALALGVKNKGQGYLENESYVISWCVGHLLELERPEAYMDLDKVGRRWSLQRLPVLPAVNSFRRVVKAGTSQQFQVLKKWLQAPEIERVICGTDADREGQLLFQEVWDIVQCTKPLARLWISSLTTEAIREGMNNLLSAQTVAGLAAAGYGRSMADWDFGMNLTEGFTALFGSFDPVRKKPNVISIGRVQTPTLALITEREWEIEQFVPETYYEVIAAFQAEQGEYQGTWLETQQESNQKGKPAAGKNNKQEGGRLNERRLAEAIAAKIQGRPGRIVKAEQKKVSEPPPLLFDLTSLTVTASKRYGMSAEKVLEVAQSLYERKAITYPRTDCAYLPADIIPKLPAHLAAVRQDPYTASAEEAGSYGVPKSKRVINTITAHHAIIPTTEKIRLEKLAEAERLLYDLIVRRFLAVWYPAAWYLQTEIITNVEQELFRTKGRILLSPGWKMVYGSDEQENRPPKGKQAEDENKELPPVQLGEMVLTKEVRIEEKSTKPPKRYTQGDLLKVMESAGKQIEDDVLRQQMKGKGLGTVATRPAIIENLLQRGYIYQQQKALKPTEKGTELIALIKSRLPRARLLISAEMTGQLEYELAQVEKGEQTLENYMAEVAAEIRSILAELRAYEQNHGKTPLSLSPVGSEKNEGLKKKGQGRSKGAKAAAAKAEGGNKRLLAAGPAEGISGEQTQPESRPAENLPATLGVCPKCGGNVIEGRKGYGCANWKKGCTFVVWKTSICGKILTVSQIKCLLKKGRTPLLKGFKSKNGKSFNAYLVWEEAAQGKIKFEFPGPEKV
jgi:DNA topoisomerase-3